MQPKSVRMPNGLLSGRGVNYNKLTNPPLLAVYPLETETLLNTEAKNTESMFCYVHLPPR